VSTSRLRYFCLLPSAWLPGLGGSGPPVGPTITRRVAGLDGQPVTETVTLLPGMPREAYEAVVTPGDASRAMMVVEHWDSAFNEDCWRATPGVVSLPDAWDWGRTVPPVAVTLFGPLGVVGTDTMAQAAQKIRAWWPRLRH
jgi:hypothetical protein